MNRDLGISPTSCYLIGDSMLLLECARILHTQSFLIQGVVSSSGKIKAWSQENNINHFHSLADIHWQAFSTDYLFSIVNSEIIPIEILKRVRKLAINYHDAPLPRYAGSHSTSWAIINGESTHAVSWHLMDECIDGGDLLQQSLITLDPDETTLSLNLKCIEQAINSFAELVNSLINDNYQRTPQNLAARTYFNRSQKPANNGWINWNSPAEQIETLYRATQFGDYANPLTTAKIVLNGELFIIESLLLLPEWSDKSPGTLLEMNSGYWKIATQTHVILLSALSSDRGDAIQLDDLVSQYHLAVGMQLTSTKTAAGKAFLNLSQHYFATEHFWVNTLQRFQPTAVAEKQANINLQQLPEAIYAQVLNYANKVEETPCLILTAWLVYLYRLEAQAELSVFIQLPDIHISASLRPFFADYYPFTITIDEQESFHQLLARVKTEYQLLTAQGGYLKDIWRRYPELGHAAAKNGGYQLTLAPITCLHSDNESRLPNPFLTLCAALIQHTDQAIATVDWVSQGERQQLLFDWNATDTPYPSQKSIHALFEEQVIKTPDQLAVMAPDAALTYQELNQRANQVAHYLLKQHRVTPDQLIPVYLERSHWMLISLLAILKSGCAYVPIDPGYPANRAAFLLSDSQAGLIITTQAQAEQLRQITAVDWQKIRMLIIDQPELLTRLDHCANVNPAIAVTSQQLAYVMYTSGTTGVPKGVAIEHRGIVNQICWMNHCYPLSMTDRVLQRTPYVFDISVWELFWANFVGATVVLAKPEGHKAPDYLIQLIKTAQISIIQFTPSMLNEFLYALATQRESLCSLRHLFCIGEILDVTTVNQAKVLLPDCQIHNLYGPTEASINVLSYDCLEQHPVLIGKPIANTRAYVLDSQYRLLPIGMSGELYIAGTGLARGYLNQPELTRQHFIANPFQREQDKQHNHYDRLYKTGDLARWLPDGELDFLGRNDSQIKLHGHRIELGEIEQVLHRYPEIQQAVVVVINHQITAYYVAQHQLNAESLQCWIADYLPGYMLPQHFLFLTHFPLDVNGKVDKKKLPLPVQSSSEAIVLPGNTIQAALLMLFAAALSLEQADISIDDDFFKLGGDSILAIRLVSQINNTFDRKVQVKDILALKTIRKISQLLQTEPCAAIEPITDYVPFSLVDKQQYQDELDLDTVEDIYPASYLQIGMLLESNLSNYSTYNNTFFYTIDLPFNQDRFIEIWENLVSKHALLRAYFLHHAPNGLVVVILKESTLSYQLFINKPLEELIVEEKTKYLSNSKENLFHLIINKHKEYFDLILSFHHAIMDGWSIANLINEFIQKYKQEHTLLFEQNNLASPLSYGEFVRNEIVSLQDQASIDFWLKYLNNYSPITTDWKFDDISTSADGTYCSKYSLTSEEGSSIQRLAQKLMISTDCIFLYAYIKTLAFFLNSSDIVVGVGFNNRLEKEGGDTLLGLFMNVLPFRFQVNQDKDLQTTLSHVFNEKIKIHSYKHIPYAHIKSILKEKIYTFGFNFTHFHILKEHDTVLQNQDGLGRISIPFLLEVSQYHQYDIALKAHDSYISESYLHYFANYFKCALKNILQNKNELTLIAKDYQKTVVDWNGCFREPTHHKTLHEIFEEQVQKQPNAIALTFEEKDFTYKELNREANQLAHYLLRCYQVKSEELIALCLDRSELIVIAILAIFKAGAAYVPIEPGYPDERISFILQDSKTRIVLADAMGTQRVSLFPQYKFELLSLNNIYHKKQIQYQPTTSPALSSNNNQLAYVIYTSGTTGKPNGVLVEHKGVINMVYEVKNIYKLTENKNIAFYFSFAFDPSLQDMFVALSFGCRLFVLPNHIRYDLHNLCDYLIKKSIQITSIPTSMLSEFIQTYKHSGLELIFTGGDKLPLDPNLNIDSLSYKIINEYGPTETTVFTTYKEVSKANNGKININNIGSPLANTQCFVFGENKEMIPIGAVGELYVGGDGLARGYLNNPELTARKFNNVLMQTKTTGEQKINIRLYRTGDLVRWLPDGNLEFITRNDRQIKIRGHRIELGEIENILLTSPKVKQGVITTLPILNNRTGLKQDTCLVAYYVKEIITSKEDEIEFISKWKSINESEYETLNCEQYQENTQGWNSSYTGEPIPKNEMLEWRDQTLERVVKVTGKRVLEIGCGSGLILFNLLDHCEHYYATDISENVISHIKNISQQLNTQDKVTLLQCSTESIPFDLLIGNYDTAILNSLIQYLPNLEYLDNLLNSIVDNMSSGKVFIGDIRDFRLLNHFHYSLLKFKEAPLNTTTIEFSAKKEKELLIDPDYFINFKNKHPRVTAIQLFPKLTQAINEMSCYRYDVVLYVGKVDHNLYKVNHEEFIYTTDLLGFLAKHSSDSIYIKYPNKKIAREYCEYQALHNKHGILSEENLVNLLPVTQMQELLYKNEYMAQFYLDAVDPLYLNIVAYKNICKTNEYEIIYENKLTSNIKKANSPVENIKFIEADFDEHILSHMQQHLPDYMLPNYLIALNNLPVTSNGKIDHQALPYPCSLGITNREYIPPTTDIETRLCSVFSEIIGIQQENISIKDDFFNIGGNSLLVFKLISEIKSLFDIQLQPIVIFKHKSIKNLSKFIANHTHIAESIIEKNKKATDFMLFNDSFLSAIDAIESSLYWKDLEGRYLSCNKYMLNMLDLTSREYVIGKKDIELWSFEDANKIQKSDRIAIEQGYYEGEEHITLANGNKEIYWSIKNKLHDAEGNIVGIAGNDVNIGNVKKKSEHEQQKTLLQLEKTTLQIIDLIDASIYWKDLNGCYLGCNAYVVKLLGANSREEVIGKTDYELLKKHDARRITMIDQSVIKNGYYNGEECGQIDDKQIFLLTTKNQLLNSSSDVVGLVGVSLDITAQKEAEALRAETVQQQIILKEREEFRKIVGQAVHDIGSPLTSLGIMLEIGLDLPEEDRNTLREIATRINDIAANLLTYYRPKHLAAEAMTEKRKPVLISLALLTLLAEKRYQYQGKQVSFETDFQPGCYFIFAELEESAFKRMLSNLINNAVDALEEQPGVVALGFSVDNGVIKITIQDSGKGMSTALIEKITSNITVTEGKENGHGIGLMQVHETLERNQGTFTIDSKIGQGTTITLTFPVCPAPAWIVEQITLNNKDTVVILDDEPTIHTAWAAHFKRVAPEIELVHFTQADEALEFISGFVAQEQIMLLTDYELLKQPYTGLEVIEQAQINHAVLVTSHYADPSIQKQAIQLGVTILPKQLAAELSIQLSD